MPFAFLMNDFFNRMDRGKKAIEDVKRLRLILSEARLHLNVNIPLQEDLNRRILKLMKETEWQ